MRQEGPSYFRLSAIHHDAALAALRRKRGHLRALNLVVAFKDEGWRAHQRRISGDLDSLHALDVEHDRADTWLFFKTIAPFVKPGSFLSVVVDDRAERWTFDGTDVVVSNAAHE